LPALSSHVQQRVFHPISFYSQFLLCEHLVGFTYKIEVLGLVEFDMEDSTVTFASLVFLILLFMV